MTEASPAPVVTVTEPPSEPISEVNEPSSRRSSMVDIADETDINTQLNAMLYHTCDDSVELYKLQNNSSDLLGRLYYDDYDSESVLSPLSSGQITPTTTGSSGSMPSSIPAIDFGYLQQAMVRSASQLKTPSIRPGLPRLQSFERGVSFDIPDTKSKKSLIVKVRHPQFKFRRNNKTFLVGFNDDFESSKAIEWLFDEMVIHGDTLVIFQVLNEKYHDTIDKKRANLNLEHFEKLNCHNKKVSIIFETVIGKAEKKLKRAIEEYRPSMMVIGTHEGKDTHHHRSLWKSSISKHFLEYALVPVIVVKPSYKYVEELKNPIDSESYFENWIKGIDVQPNINYPPRKESKRLSRMLSPSPSRSSSSQDLVGEARGRDKEPLHIRSSSREGRSRSRSRTKALTSFFTGH